MNILYLKSIIEQVHAESKLENLEDQLRRAKTQADEFARQNGDLNNWKARLSQENLDLQRQVQELDSSNGGLSKTKSVLLAQLDEAKAKGWTIVSMKDDWKRIYP